MGKHRIEIENREAIELSGVIEVINFSEEQISLATELGPLVIVGTELNIQHLNLDDGELIIDGQLISLDYSAEQKEGGILSNLFK